MLRVFTENDTKKIQIDEGIVVLNLGQENERILGPTRGGVEMTITPEIRDIDFVSKLSKRLKDELNAELVFIWVNASPETCHRRMVERNSTRDTWKLENWDEYIKDVDFSIPTPLSSKESGAKLIVFDNDHDDTFESELKKTVNLLEKE